MPKVLVAAGFVVAAIGVVCFLSLFDQSHAQDVRDIGSAAFAIGVLMVAFGLYLQARQLRVQYQQTATAKAKRTERLCASCNREPSVLFCRVHVLRLCLNCFDKHDDGTNCSYVPAKRAAAAYK